MFDPHPARRPGTASYFYGAWKIENNLKYKESIKWIKEN